MRGRSRCVARRASCGKRWGLKAGELLRLGVIFTAPGFCDGRIHLFLARQLTPTAQQLGQDEVLSVSRIPLPQALDMILRRRSDAKTIAGLHHAAAYLARQGLAP